MDFSLYSQSQNSFGQSSQSSSFFKPSVARKFDMRIVEKLINYVESTLDAKLQKISDLARKNLNSLDYLRKKMTIAEMDVIKLKREKEVGQGSLLSEDIKFFFNMVKANPSLKKSDLDDSSYQNPHPKYEIDSKKAMAHKPADNKENQNAHIYNRPSKSPQFTGRNSDNFGIGTKKVHFQEQGQPPKRSKTPVRNSDRSVV